MIVVPSAATCGANCGGEAISLIFNGACKTRDAQCWLNATVLDPTLSRASQTSQRMVAIHCFFVDLTYASTEPRLHRAGTTVSACCSTPALSAAFKASLVTDLSGKSNVILFQRPTISVESLSVTVAACGHGCPLAVALNVVR